MVRCLICGEEISRLEDEHFEFWTNYYSREVDDVDIVCSDCLTEYLDEVVDYDK